MTIIETVFIGLYWWDRKNWGFSFTRSAKRPRSARFYYLDLGPLELRVRV